jgi:hypothetical protein
MKLAPDTIADINECCALALHLAAEAQRAREAIYRHATREEFEAHLDELASAANSIGCRTDDITENLDAVEAEDAK